MPANPLPAARLRKMKAIALLLLLCAVSLLVLAQWQGRAGVWAWVGAFAEAATIGALADWFAVVALFRHPLGVPIPHTAIIPRKKQRIAQALSDFLVNHFLAHEKLLARLQALNLAKRLGLFLTDATQREKLLTQLQTWLTQSLAALDSPKIDAALFIVLQQQLQRLDASSIAANLLRTLSAGEHHQKLLNAGLEQIGRWLDQAQVRAVITEKLIERARHEFPKLTWLTDKFDYTQPLALAVSEKLANALIDEVQRILHQPDHPLRQHYSAEAARLLQRLEKDAQFRAQVEQFKHKLLNSRLFDTYLQQSWTRLRQWLMTDLKKPDSVCMRYLRDYSARLAQRWCHDTLWQDTTNAQLLIAAAHLAQHVRRLTPHYIAQTIAAWDTTAMVDEIEASIGRDLQFIRINGTVIGGLAGLALHALLLLF